MAKDSAIRSIIFSIYIQIINNSKLYDIYNMANYSNLLFKKICMLK